MRKSKEFAKLTEANPDSRKNAEKLKGSSEKSQQKSEAAQPKKQEDEQIKEEVTLEIE